MKEGGGEPVAEHLKDTGGPGCKVCLINVYCSSGTVSAHPKKKINHASNEASGNSGAKVYCIYMRICASLQAWRGIKFGALGN